MYKMMEPFPTDDLDLQYVCYKGERVFVSSWHILPIDKGLRMLTGHLLILTHFTLSFPFLTTQELGPSLILDPFTENKIYLFLLDFVLKTLKKNISFSFIKTSCLMLILWDCWMGMEQTFDE